MTQETQEAPEPQPADREFIGASMVIGAVITLAIVSIWGGPLLALAPHPVLADLPWLIIWLTATFAARTAIRRSVTLRQIVRSCNAKTYGRVLSERAADRVERLFRILLRVAILIVCVAIALGLMVVAFYD
ncbi:MAG: hypothetical protein P8K78_09000 [Pirellulales bacterium]|nr:hypothetical protein [Pirellulales bacterium]